MIKQLLTDQEVKILKHALGYPKNYRNYYFPGGSDIKKCENIVKKNFMVRQSMPWLDGDIYQVTPEGREALKVDLKNEQD